MFHRRRPATTTTRSSKPTLMTRLRGPNARKKTVKTKTTTTRHGPAPTTTRRGPAPATHHTATTGKRRWGTTRPQHHHHHHHHHRKPSIGDKFSGAMLRLKGSLTHRPGVKAAGSRRMHGTDGRGSHHVY